MSRSDIWEGFAIQINSDRLVLLSILRAPSALLRSATSRASLSAPTLRQNICGSFIAEALLIYCGASRSVCCQITEPHVFLYRKSELNAKPFETQMLKGRRDWLRCGAALKERAEQTDGLAALRLIISVRFYCHHPSVSPR
jgi:hypothetical protein